MPLAILLVIPFGVFGAFLGLLLRGFDNNVYTQVGLIMLIGLAAKNAILIVEFAKLARDRGEATVEAALRAARLRLRPIIMTSFAFIFGSIPLAIATGAGAGARPAIGVTVVANNLDLKIAAANVEALRRFRDLAEVRYQEGVTIYLELANAQDQLFNAELALTATQSKLFQSYANLYRAMGGGSIWSAQQLSSQRQDPIATPQPAASR